MQRIKISQLDPGMILAEDVYGRTGEMLIPMGGQLTEKSIHLLKLWSIPSVAVEGEDAFDVLDKFAPDQIQEAEKEVGSKFTINVNDIPLISQLFKLCVQRKLMQKYPDPAELAEGKTCEEIKNEFEGK